MGKVYDRKEKAIYVTSKLEDFDGDVQKWKDAFYELWRYQMTYSFAYKIEVKESGGSYFERKVFVDLLVRENYKDNVIDLMKTLGYQNINISEETIGIIDGYEHDILDLHDIILDI